MTSTVPISNPNYLCSACLLCVELLLLSWHFLPFCLCGSVFIYSLILFGLPLLVPWTRNNSAVNTGSETEQFHCIGRCMSRVGCPQIYSWSWPCNIPRIRLTLPIILNLFKYSACSTCADAPERCRDILRKLVTDDADRTQENILDRLRGCIGIG